MQTPVQYDINYKRYAIKIHWVIMCLMQGRASGFITAAPPFGEIMPASSSVSVRLCEVVLKFSANLSSLPLHAMSLSEIGLRPICLSFA